MNSKLNEDCVPKLLNCSKEKQIKILVVFEALFK